jgi:hypothetical protein
MLLMTILQLLFYVGFEACPLKFQSQVFATTLTLLKKTMIVYLTTFFGSPYYRYEIFSDI